MTRSLSGSSNPNWKGGLIKKTCIVCGCEFSVKQVHAKAKFCSMRCVGISQRGVPLTRRSKSYRSKKVTKRCLACDIEFQLSQSESKKTKCCSFKCQGVMRSRLQSGAGNPNWHGGLALHPYPYNFRVISREIIKRDGEACQNPDCAGTDPRMTAHHIDYDKSHCDGSNLITLCSSCNSKANFNRQHWQTFYTAMMAVRFKITTNPYQTGDEAYAGYHPKFAF